MLVVKNPPAKQEMLPVQSQGEENPLEVEMATHSSILVWEIQWTRNLVGCSPWGHTEVDSTEHGHRH